MYDLCRSVCNGSTTYVMVGSHIFYYSQYLRPMDLVMGGLNYVILIHPMCIHVDPSSVYVVIDINTNDPHYSSSTWRYSMLEFNGI